MKRIALIGMGPRGLSVLDRLLVRLKAEPEPVHITAFDRTHPGGGRIWNPGQPRWLTMNTTVGQTSIYSVAPADQSYAEGRPSLLTWLADHPEHGSYGFHDFAPRGVYGEYLHAALRNLIASAPDGVTVDVHTAEITSLVRDGGAWTLTDADGLRHGADGVVLATGHPRNVLTPEERDLAGFAAAGRGLSYILADSPADIDLADVPSGETVLVRGLGLSFYDIVLGLTEGRGGTFERTRGALRYQKSGTEPLIVAGSRSSVPFLPRAHNQKGLHGRHSPVFFTSDAVAALRRAALAGNGTGQLDFAAHVEPLIDAEIQYTYRKTWIAARDGHAAAADYEAALRQQADPVVVAEKFDVADLHLDWKAMARPFAGRVFADDAEFQRELLDMLRADLVEASLGNVGGPVKAAIDVLRDLRAVVRQATDHGGLLPASHRDDLAAFTSVHATIAAGPPKIRVEQLVALMEAGIVRVLGADARFETGSDMFTAESPAVAGSAVTARTLIDARVPGPRFGQDASPLISGLIRDGHLTAHVLTDPETGDSCATGAVRVTSDHLRAVAADGTADPSLHTLGIPIEGVSWFTFVGMGRPDSDDFFFRTADSVALSLLALEGRP